MLSAPLLRAENTAAECLRVRLLRRESFTAARLVSIPALLLLRGFTDLISQNVLVARSSKHIAALV